LLKVAKNYVRYLTDNQDVVAPAIEA